MNINDDKIYKRDDDEMFHRAYMRACELNEWLTIPVLARLAKKSELEIEAIQLGKKRFPNFQMCYEVFRVIKICQGKMPVELFRIIQATTSRTDHVIRAMKDLGIKGSGPAELIPAKEIKCKTYLFNGRQRTIKQIHHHEDVKLTEEMIQRRIEYYCIKERGEITADVIDGKRQYKNV